jgi:hypothetical protein
MKKHTGSEYERYIKAACEPIGKHEHLARLVPYTFLAEDLTRKTALKMRQKGLCTQINGVIV